MPTPEKKENGELKPQPGQSIFRLPRLRRTHNFSVLASSSISGRYTR